MTLGELMELRRSELGLSQVEAAAQIGVERSAYMRYENDRGYPTVRKRGKLATWLRIEISELPKRPVAS